MRAALPVVKATSPCICSHVHHTHQYSTTDLSCVWGMQMRLNWKSEAFTAWNRTSLGR
jgi:hypothetical protein